MKSDTQILLDKALDNTPAAMNAEGGSKLAPVQQMPDFSNMALKNLYYSYTKRLAFVQNKPKYKIYGEITDTSEYPEALCIFGVALRDQPSESPPAFDKCVHINSNICVLKPVRPPNNLFYKGQHCCLDLTLEGKNAYGVSVPMFIYGDCTIDKELNEIKEEINEELLGLYRQSGASRASHVAATVENSIDNEMKSAFAFLDAIGRADGNQAVMHVVAYKRNKGAYIPAKMNEYYGSLERPITIIDMFNDNASNVVATYYSKEYGKPGKIVFARISMVDVAGEKQIEKITHLVEVEY